MRDSATYPLEEFCFVTSTTSRCNECCNALKNKLSMIGVLSERLNKPDTIEEIVWIETNERYSEK